MITINGNKHGIIAVFTALQLFWFLGKKLLVLMSMFLQLVWMETCNLTSVLLESSANGLTWLLDIIACMF